MHPSFRRVFFIAFALIVSLEPGFAQSKGYDVLHYGIDLTILRADTSIAGRVTMTGRTDRILGGIIQHAKYLTIDSVFVNNARATFNVVDAASGAYNVIAPVQLPSDAEFTVQTFYHGKGKPEDGPNAWGGVQHDGNMMYALGVGFHAPYISCTRHWLPCYDLPDDKANSVTLAVSTQAEDFVASNGQLLQVIDDLPGGWKQYIWDVRHPIATYLLTFAVGPFEVVNTHNPKNVPFETYALPADTAKVSAVMSKRVVNALAFFDSLFAPYPFEKVGYVVADIGSMEHQTMITLARAGLDTNGTTAVHELAHMWWGDWVTCKDFNDPWLNEGFATYCEALFLERFFGKSQYWKAHKANISGAISSGSNIPLYGTPLTTKPSSNYPTGVLYNKGAAVLGMLRYFIGDSLFFSAIREYGKRHAYSTATSYDLEGAFEDVTGQDLGWFFKKWVFGTGYPKLRVSWTRNGSDVTVNFEDTSSKGYFRLPLVVEAMTKTGLRERHTVWLDSTKFSQATFTNSFVPDSLIVDPDGAVIKRIVGRVTLGVEPDAIGRITGLTEKGIYLITFSANPTDKTEVLATLSPAPAVYRTDLPSSAYANRQMADLNTGKYRLAFYDSNARQVHVQHLANPSVSSTSQLEVQTYTYSVDISDLESGTYLAVILLNNDLVAGHARLVVQR